MEYQVRRYEFPGKVWTLKTDLGGETICVESRLGEGNEVKVQYSLLNMDSGQKKSISNEIGLAWRYSLAGFTGRYIFLHEYADSGMPLIDSTVCVDSVSGRICWKIGNVHFSSATGSEVCLVSSAEGQASIYSIESRKHLRDGELAVLQEVSIVFPERTFPGESLYEVLAGKLRSAGIEDDFIEMQATELEGGEVVAAHKQMEDGYHLELFCLDNTGLKARNVLMEQSKKMMPEAFMVFGERIIALAEENALLVIS